MAALVRKYFYQRVYNNAYRTAAHNAKISDLVRLKLDTTRVLLQIKDLIFYLLSPQHSHIITIVIIIICMY